MVGGFPKDQRSFARIMGYCQQADVHAPFVSLHPRIVLPHYNLDAKNRYIGLYTPDLIQIELWLWAANVSDYLGVRRWLCLDALLDLVYSKLAMLAVYPAQFQGGANLTAYFAFTRKKNTACLLKGRSIGKARVESVSRRLLTAVKVLVHVLEDSFQLLLALAGHSARGALV